MRQLRFGSYSTAATLAGTPSLMRRKSTTRYWRLWPPPLWRAVLRPWLLRPPEAGRGSSSARSGVVLVISEKSETVWNRRPGLVGLRLRRGIALSLEEVDRVAVGQRDQRSLDVGAVADLAGAAVADGLALAVQRVHLRDRDPEDRLDRIVDLGLRRVGGDDERVDVRLEQPVGLLAHDRPDDDVTRIPHDAPPGSVSCVKITQSATSTS